MPSSVQPGPPSSADQWARDLESWAIPEKILAQAPSSPWEFPPGILERRADRAAVHESPSSRIARQALPEGGTVLDVGCGPGAASLPLADRASLLAGVDTDARLLGEFESRARSLGVQVLTIKGRWPDIAGQAPTVDLAVCHHVAYNVPDLAEFALRLTEKARSRVVLELTAVHPRAYLNDLWMHFHHLPRPTRPTATDAEAVLREAGLEIRREDWTPTDSGTWYASIDEAVAWTARTLCLSRDRYGELRPLIEPGLLQSEGMLAQRPRPRTTIWWDGRAAA